MLTEDKLLSSLTVYLVDNGIELTVGPTFWTIVDSSCGSVLDEDA